MTESTDNTNTVRGGAVLYDGACGICSTAARRWAGPVGRVGLCMLPLQTTEARAISGLREDELRTEVKVVTADREILGGVDAILYVARRIWWARPATWVARLVPRRALDAAYRWVVRNRYRLSDACGLDGACALPRREAVSHG